MFTIPENWMFDSGLKTFDVGTGVLFFPQKKSQQTSNLAKFFAILLLSACCAAKVTQRVTQRVT